MRSVRTRIAMDVFWLRPPHGCAEVSHSVSNKVGRGSESVRHGNGQTFACFVRVYECVRVCENSEYRRRERTTVHKVLQQQQQQQQHTKGGGANVFRRSTV